MIKRLAGIMLCVAAMCAGAWAEGEFHPGEVWLDDKGVPINAHGGGILFYKGWYYWYGEHKTEGAAGNRAQVGVHVYASRDLYHWKDEGIALEVSGDPQSDIAKGCVLERPKVLHNPKTGKFVMWFHLELRGQGYNSARAGVAVADAPVGPFRYLESFRLNAGCWPVNFPEKLRRPLDEREAAAFQNGEMRKMRNGVEKADLMLRRGFTDGQMSRDMTLFADDDGNAYQVASSEDNATLHISRLTADYLKPDGRYVRVFPGAYREAPALFKRGEKYYLITSACTGWNPNAAKVAVAGSIWGPWTFLDNPCMGTREQMNTTFESQSTYVFPVEGIPGAFIFMADRWRPLNAIDGRYVWLPVLWRDGGPSLGWRAAWSLGLLKEELKKD